MNNIKQVREEKGISRGELARCSGVPIRTLDAWETGLRTPSNIYQLHKICIVLCCKFEDLVDLDSDE